MFINSFTVTGDDNRLFANSIDPDVTAHNEPSHLGLRCLTFSVSTLHINFFPMDSLFRTKTDDKCRLNFDSKRVKSFERAHDKTNNLSCAPRENSDQPEHPPILNSLPSEFSR